MLLAAGLAGLFFLPTPWNVVVVVVAALVEVGEVFLWIKFLGRYRVSTGAEGMIGERAEAIEDCFPRGTVRVRGEIWSAEAGEPGLRAGQRGRVRAVEGLTLRVEADSQLVHGN